MSSAPAPARDVAASGGAPRLAFRPDVEGLRAIAILAVVGYHAGLPLLGGGFVGVDVFFVISGFLITGLLVREARATGRVALATFWARRARRLLPAATLVLAFVAVVSWWVIPAIDHRDVGFDVTTSALYVANLRFAAQSMDYLGSDATTSPVLHFWSLGVEEQFYLVWPLVVLAVAFAARSRRGSTGLPSRRALALALAALGIASFALSLRLTARAEPWAFFGMPTRAWEFALGGLVAIGTPELARVRSPLRRVVGLLGAVAVVGSVVLLDADLPYPGTAALWPVLGATAVIAAGTTRADRAVAVPRLLSTRPMRAVGRVSYSWYLWHWPLLVLAAAAWGRLSVPQSTLVVLVSLVPALLAYRLVERPLHHLPALVASPRRSLLLGGTLSGAAALCGLALALAPGGGALASGLQTADGADAQTGRDVASAPAGPADTPAAPPSAPTPAAAAGRTPSPSPTPAAVSWPTGPLTPAPDQARADLPVTYADGCHLSIPATTWPACAFGDTASAVTLVLFGDSHAAQWFPALQALADKYHWKLLSRTKSGCPAPDVTILQRSLKRPYDECDSWRRAVIDEIRRSDRPTLVVAAGTRTDSLVDRATGGPIARAGAGAEWQAGWRRTLTDLTSAGVAVAVMRDTPWPGFDVPRCLSQHPSEPSACDASRGALDSPKYDVGTTSGLTGAHPVDLTRYLCDATRCPATRGRYLVYRDTDHLTATFSRALSPYLYDALAPLLR